MGSLPSGNNSQSPQAPVWYVAVDGKATGPYSLQKIGDLYFEGSIQPEQLVTAQHLGGSWIPAEEVIQSYLKRSGGAPLPPRPSGEVTAIIDTAEIKRTDPALSLFEVVQSARGKNQTSRTGTGSAATSQPGQQSSPTGSGVSGASSQKTPDHDHGSGSRVNFLEILIDLKEKFSGHPLKGVLLAGLLGIAVGYGVSIAVKGSKKADHQADLKADFKEEESTPAKLDATAEVETIKPTAKDSAVTQPLKTLRAAPVTGNTHSIAPRISLPRPGISAPRPFPLPPPSDRDDHEEENDNNDVPPAENTDSLMGTPEHTIHEPPPPQSGDPAAMDPNNAPQPTEETEIQ